MIRIRLKRLLALAERNQTWLAKETNIRLATVSNLCLNKSKHLPIDVIDRICKALDCQPGDWLEYHPDEPQE